MNAFLRIGTILCWVIAIGAEYVAQVWPRRKKMLTILAVLGFVLALSGEYASYRYDEIRQSELEAKIRAQGIPEVEWFQAQTANNQTFTIKGEALPGSVEVLINGLIEPADIYTVSGQEITLHTELGSTDVVIIKYRRAR